MGHNPIYEMILTNLTQIKLHDLNGPTSIMGTTGNHGWQKCPVVKWQTLNGAIIQGRMVQWKLKFR